MEVKQEPDDLFIEDRKIYIQQLFFPNEIVKKYCNTDIDNTQISNVIKQENGTNLNINHLLQTGINPNTETKRIINGRADIKCNFVPINYVKQSRKGTTVQWNLEKEWILSGDILICKICGNLYTRRFELFRHSVQHLVKKTPPIQSKLCIAKLQDLSSQINDNKIYPKYLKQNNFNNCMCCHTVGKASKCRICLNFFSFKSSSSRHMRHTEKNISKCEIGSKLFRKKCNMIQHMLCHCQRDKKRFQCEICSKSFTTNYGLNLHKWCHTGEKLFKCEICLKIFSLKKTLNVHMRTHTADNPFQCEICSKSFTTNYGQSLHVRNHTGEKSFKCDICSKTFTRKAALIPHMHCHTGEKPHQCEICLKIFSLKKNFKCSHAYSHS